MKTEANSKKVIKSGIWYTLSNFLVKSIGLLTTPIFARLLTKTEFGLYNNYISWLGILTIIVTLNLESTLISARYDFEEKFDEYILSVLSLSAVSVFVWSIVLNVFSSNITELFGLDMIYVNCMMIYMIFIPAINLYQAREQYYFEYKKSVFIGLLMAIGTAFGSVLLVAFMQNGLLGRVLGNVVPVVAIGIVLYIILAHNGKRLELSYWKYALKICIPFIPHLLSLTILNSVDKVMITNMCGAEDNALYSLAYSCGALVTLLITSLNSAYSPWLGERLAKKDLASIRTTSKTYILVFVSLAIGIMAISPEILLVLGGKQYIEAKAVMIPVALGCVCQFLYTMYVNVEQFCKKTVGMAFASISAAVLNYILNLIFIPKYGYIAAAYTTLVGYIWLLIVHVYLVQKLNLGQVYSKKITFTALGIAVICGFFISILYNYTAIRYIFILFYGLGLIYAVLKNKNAIASFLKK